MGTVESHSEEESRFFGYRIYKIFNGGPISQTIAKELEDFIIPPAEVFEHKIEYIDYIKGFENKEMEINLYSLKKRCFHKVTIVPNLSWGEGKLGLIGASVRLEKWSTAHKNLVRVLSVIPNSIAENVGIKALEDYIISIRPQNEDIYTLNVENEDPFSHFSNLINKFRNKKIELIIYNNKTGTKLVNLVLKDQDVLGCELGYGKLHEFVKEAEKELKDKTEKTEVNKLPTTTEEETSKLKGNIVDIIKNELNQEMKNEEIQQELKKDEVNDNNDKKKECNTKEKENPEVQSTQSKETIKIVPVNPLANEKKEEDIVIESVSFKS